MRDGTGRVGYVVREGLTPVAPPVVPDWPFSGCRRQALENDDASCQTRARGQLEQCRQGCAKGTAPDCDEKCANRFNECSHTCEGQMEASPAPPAPPTPDTEAVQSGTADAGTVEAAAPEPPAKGKWKGKGKKAKGKKGKGKKKGG